MANLIDIAFFIFIVSLADGQITPLMLLLIALYLAVRLGYPYYKKRRK